jgi:signal transduction histidine kinase
VVLQEEAAGPDDPPSANFPETMPGEKKIVRLTVADSGAGIAPQHLPHLFEPFYRADKARSHADQHLGLGLFLVREHLRSLAGECKVESPWLAAGIDGVPVRGSKFIVTIPMVMLRPDISDSQTATAAVVKFS